jgi:FMN-dependent NADH-azoreductase
VYARGGEYPGGTAGEAFDMQSKYVAVILGFMGFKDVRSVIVEPTLQGGPDVAKTRVREAIDRAKEMAVNF